MQVYVYVCIYECETKRRANDWNAGKFKAASKLNICLATYHCMLGANGIRYEITGMESLKPTNDTACK